MSVLKISQLAPLFAAAEKLVTSTKSSAGANNLSGQLAAKLAPFSSEKFKNDFSMLQSGDETKQSEALQDLAAAFSAVGGLVSELLAQGSSSGVSNITMLAATQFRDGFAAINTSLPSSSSSASTAAQSAMVAANATGDPTQGFAASGDASAAGASANTTDASASTAGVSVLPKQTGAKLTNAQVRDDLTNALAEHDPIKSDRALGRKGGMAIWTDEKVDSLRRGIEAAQPFYPGIAVHDLAKLIVAQGAQECSGDFNLNVGGGPGDGQGFLQVTNQSSLAQFKEYATPIKDAEGKVVVDPKGPIDLSDPAQNVAIAAWYSRNGTSLGQSPDEKYKWNNEGTLPDSSKDYGNALFTWNQGPHNDRHTGEGKQAFSDYYNRISDYWVTSGFGSASDFDKLLDTPLGAKTVDTVK